MFTMSVSSAFLLRAQHRYQKRYDTGAGEDRMASTARLPARALADVLKMKSNESIQKDIQALMHARKELTPKVFRTRALQNETLVSAKDYVAFPTVRSGYYVFAKPAWAPMKPEPDQKQRRSNSYHGASVQQHIQSAMMDPGNVVSGQWQSPHVLWSLSARHSGLICVAVNGRPAMIPRIVHHYEVLIHNHFPPTPRFDPICPPNGDTSVEARVIRYGYYGSLAISSIILEVKNATSAPLAVDKLISGYFKGSHIVGDGVHAGEREADLPRSFVHLRTVQLEDPISSAVTHRWTTESCFRHLIFDDFLDRRNKVTIADGKRIQLRI